MKGRERGGEEEKRERERVGKKKETRPSGSDSSSPLMKTLAMNIATTTLILLSSNL